MADRPILQGMTRLPLVTACLIALALPATAQEEDRLDDLFRKLEDLGRDAQTLLDDWMDEIGPRLEELAPLFEDLAEKLDDITAYHPPEVLPNGDIIIRRKTPPPDPLEDEVPVNPDGSVDL